MKHIYEINNEASPGTKENWYEVYDESKKCDNPNDTIRSGLNYPHFGQWPGKHVATFHTRDELEIYLRGLKSFHEVQACLEAVGSRDWDTNKYKHEIIPYESNDFTDDKPPHK